MQIGDRDQLFTGNRCLAPNVSPRSRRNQHPAPRIRYSATAAPNGTSMPPEASGLGSVRAAERLPELFGQLVRLELNFHADHAVTVGFGLEPNPWPVVTVEPLPHFAERGGKRRAGNPHLNDPHSEPP